MRTFFLKLFNKLNWGSHLFTLMFSRRVFINFIFKNLLVVLITIIFIALMLFIVIICKKVDDNMLKMCFKEVFSRIYIEEAFPNSIRWILWLNLGDINNLWPEAKSFFAFYNKLGIMRPVDKELFIEIAPSHVTLHILRYPGHSVAFEYSLNAINCMKSYLMIDKKHGAYSNSEDFAYVDFVFTDARVCRTIYQYLRWVGDAGYITDKETLLLYEHHFKIILDLMLDGEAFAEDYKLTFDEVMVSLNFVKNIIEMAKLKEEWLARSIFEAMDAVRNKKRI